MKLFSRIFAFELLTISLFLAVSGLVVLGKGSVPSFRLLLAVVVLFGVLFGTWSGARATPGGSKYTRLPKAFAGAFFAMMAFYIASLAGVLLWAVVADPTGQLYSFQHLIEIWAEVGGIAALAALPIGFLVSYREATGS